LKNKINQEKDKKNPKEIAIKRMRIEFYKKIK
jgi:hypothetical protein